MNNIDAINETGVEMSEAKQEQNYIDWKTLGQWALTVVIALFLWSVNSQASELRNGLSALSSDVQTIRVDMSNRITKLETLQAAQAQLCK